MRLRWHVLHGSALSMVSAGLLGWVGRLSHDCRFAITLRLSNLMWRPQTRQKLLLARNQVLRHCT